MTERTVAFIIFSILFLFFYCGVRIGIRIGVGRAINYINMGFAHDMDNQLLERHETLKQHFKKESMVQNYIETITNANSKYRKLARSCTPLHSRMAVSFKTNRASPWTSNDDVWLNHAFQSKPRF